MFERECENYIMSFNWNSILFLLCYFIFIYIASLYISGIYIFISNAYKVRNSIAAKHGVIYSYRTWTISFLTGNGHFHCGWHFT